jgi:hypothetical protein
LDYTEGLNGIRSTIISLPSNISYPEGAVDVVEAKGSDSKHDIQLENTEFGLLNRLLGLYIYFYYKICKHLCININDL